MDKPFPAYEGDGPYVFVCYAHSDARIVYPELRWLRDQGINVWYDEGISPGAEFPEHLGRAILGASLMLFFVSPASAASRHCRNEVFFGLDRHKPVLASYLSATELPPGLALSTGTTQALLRYAMSTPRYRAKLLAGIAELSATSSAIPVDPAIIASVDRRHRMRKLGAGLGIAAGLLLLGIGGVLLGNYIQKQNEIRHVREELMPEIRRLVDEGWRDFTRPYALAVEAEKVIPEDPELTATLDAITLRVDIDSDPPGARTWIKSFDTPDAPWTELGVTPLEDVRLPVGIFRWRLEMDGYAPVEALASSWDIGLDGENPLLPGNFFRKLDRVQELPTGTVRVAGADTPLGKVGDFYIDRLETTNTEYQRFVDAGGYRERRFWKHEFRDGGTILSFDEAMAQFVDQSGRPGPSTWLGGTYPDGMGNHPVSGVSWYEAAAYAQYAGRDLPTGMHWGLARGEDTPLIRWPQLGGLAVFMPFSNFIGSGTVEVGTLDGITAFGAHDLAGNVREWCLNETAQGILIRGGAYGDNPYRFYELGQAPPMFRAPGYGFRTVVYPPEIDKGSPEFAAVPIQPAEDYYRREMPSDELFAVFRRQFDYDRLPLNPLLLSTDNDAELWAVERVAIDTPYSSDRMIINLFLPKNTPPPYQTVIYFPGSAALFQDSSEKLDEYYEFAVFLSFLVKTGRAVAFPVYEGTFERRDDRLAGLHMGERSQAYAEYLSHLVKDFRRTVDYLETREDIDSERIAYYGMSWGGIMGAIIPAVETRPKTAILLAGGLYSSGRPESDPVSYISRITMPFLFLVGRYDTILGYESAARPLFDLLGTPDEHKQMLVYDTDHIPPKSEYVREILAWLDVYLGPARTLEASR